MANPSSPYEQLIAFKMILTERRRKIVTAALDHRTSNTMQNGEVDPGEGSVWGLEFLDVQLQIDAVDRALADEKAAASTEAYARNLRSVTE